MASSDQQAMPDSPSTSKGLTRHVQRYESGDLALSPTAHIAALQATADRLDGELARYRSGGGARAHKGGAQDKEAKKIESYKARIASLEASVASAELGLRDLTIDHAQAKRELDSVTAEITAEESNALELERTLATSQNDPVSRISAANAQAEAKEARQLRAQIARLSSSRGPGQLQSNSNLRLQAAQKDVKDLGHDLEVAKADRDARATEVARFEAELVRVTDASAVSPAPFSKSLASNVDVPRLVEMLEDLNSDIVGLRAEKMALTLELAGVES